MAVQLLQFWHVIPAHAPEDHLHKSNQNTIVVVRRQELLE
jgi:hypothetical protein